MTPAELLERGREALDAGRYAEARDAFAAATEIEESAEAYDGLGQAARWLADTEGCRAARETAYRLYRDRGDRASAAGIAIWLSNDARLVHGDESVAAGWQGRARTLLEGLGDAPERGWLALQEADKHLFHEADPLAGEAACRRAVEIGRATGAGELEHVAHAMHGLTLVALGEIDAGMAELDEASTAALAGEVSATRAGVIWCHLLYACERVRDLRRADQWCKTVRLKAEEISNRQLFGYCRTHYASVLTARGEWIAAEEELELAAADFAAAAPGAASEAALALAELRRRQGRLADAEELCRQAPTHSAAQLCLAEIAWDRGDVRAAGERLERRNRRLPPEALAGDLAALDLAVRVGVASGDAEAVERALRSLHALGDTEAARAALAYAEGILWASRDPDEARRRLEDAVDGWIGTGMPFETARARTALARNLAASGRSDDSALELALARETLAGLGSTIEPAELDRPLAATGGGRNGELSAREIEILRLVAEGLSDGEIAKRLFLSPHTVHRHVANIRTKLRQPSRAAAAAQAARDGLI